MSAQPAPSWWLQQAEARSPSPRRPPLQDRIDADIAVVGAGFTGLWTAIRLADLDPGLRIVVLERETVGFGASGRNGGFAMTMVARSLHDLVRKVGPRAARAIHLSRWWTPSPAWSASAWPRASRRS